MDQELALDLYVVQLMYLMYVLKNLDIKENLNLPMFLCLKSLLRKLIPDKDLYSNQQAVMKFKKSIFTKIDI